MERKSGRVVVLVLAGHALAAAWTWRDIRQQPAQQVRGSKTFWRISSVVKRAVCDGASERVREPQAPCAVRSPLWPREGGG